MSETYTPSGNENRNIFAVSCVESVATALRQPAAEVYQRMKRVNLSERVFILEPTINFGG